ncbi:MAG: NADH-quinone oxidoreductase subunit G [Sciscionella sp.]
MTAVTQRGDAPPVPEGHVRLTIDGIEVDAPKGELIIRVAERMGIEIPRFCDHPLLDPAAACRQCLVEVEMNGRPMPKPQPSCAITVADGMVVKTQHTSKVADKAQEGVMELLLINHPLDCPICDKGGECPLQNQAMRNGRADSRFRDTKRTFPKPIPVSTQILLDRERCVLCQRCTRFSDEIAGDPFIDLLERGVHQQVGIAEGKPFQSYYSGNTIQICPVGALTSAAYRFRSRPFDLVSTPSVCEHCASGCAQRTDWRRGKVMRRLAGDDPEVNEEWNCDKGRFAFTYATASDRFTRPMVRDRESGKLMESSWTEAMRIAAEGLAAARDASGAAVLTGGRLTCEDAYAYGKFARIALHTNDIDFRARPHSAEELQFLASHVVGTTPDDVSYADLQNAGTVLCVAFEPEEESPIVFLRLRKAARQHGAKIVHIGQFSTGSVRKTFGELLACQPGGEATALSKLPDDVVKSLAGGVILLGERAAEITGLPTAARILAERTGAKLAWIPRRAGERGALDAGAVPTLLPGGRPVSEADARAEMERAWRLAPGALPAEDGRDTAAILAAAARGQLSALVVGGVDPLDLPDPALAERALAVTDFVLSLEMRPSVVTEHADVVLPIAPAVECSGSYLNWEGRRRRFGTTLEGTGALPDCRVLDTLAIEMDVDIYTTTPDAVSMEIDRLGSWRGQRVNPPGVAARQPAVPGEGQALLATWRRLLDSGSMQANEPHLAGTAREVTALLSSATAERLGLHLGEQVTVSVERGEITLPTAAADLPDGVVWLPANSPGSSVRTALGVGHGAVVRVTPSGVEGAQRP